MSFRPTINILVDFLHRLSLERTGDAARFPIDRSGTGAEKFKPKGVPRHLSSKMLADHPAKKTYFGERANTC
jgi:hypothetical protein